MKEKYRLLHTKLMALLAFPHGELHLYKLSLTFHIAPAFVKVIH